MKISSRDKKSSLEILKAEDGSTDGIFSITCKVDIGHGVFSASNLDLYALNLQDFVADMDLFISNRDIRPTLKLTYESEIMFSCTSSPLNIMLNFVIGDSYSGYAEVTNYKLQGGFEISQGDLETILRGFRGLA